LIENRAGTAGAMMHLVTSELDRGPVVSYCPFSITGEPFARYWRKEDKDMLFHLIRQHELAREFPPITLTLQSLSRAELNIKDRNITDAQGNPICGYDLTDKVGLRGEGKPDWNPGRKVTATLLKQWPKTGKQLQEETIESGSTGWTELRV
jgi:hypothetical protein